MDGLGVSAIRIAAFRAVPHTLDLLLHTPENGKPHSLLILGENGSGKSSIVDALEFGLQGGLFGGSVNAPDAPTLRNLFSIESDDSYVDILLTNGESVRRWNRAGERHPHEIPGHTAFAQSRFT